LAQGGGEMSFIRECGHSQDIYGRWYKKHPDGCFYCEYLIKHPRQESKKGVMTERKKASLAALHLRSNSKKAKNVANHEEPGLGA
jgi:hypothetical protein